MALTPELNQLLTDIHKFMQVTLSTEGLSENTEDLRVDLISKIIPYLSHHLTVNSSHLVQSMSAFDSARSQTVTAGVPASFPEPPKAPPPGVVKKVNPKDLKSSALCEGILEKLGGKNQEKWQKRYCVLTRTYLYFFGNAKSKHQNNQIYIPSFSVSPVKERGNEKHLVFRLSSSNESKNYYFRVLEHETYTKWYNSVSQLSANSNTLSVSDGIPRPETMVFNMVDNISTASSSDEGETQKSIEEDAPPPIPPPTNSIPKSPQFLRKLTPTSPPTQMVATQPQLVVTQPVPEPVSEPVRQVLSPPAQVVNQNSDLTSPPPAPARHGSVLNPGPGVSVQQMRKLLTSQRESSSAITEGVEDGGEDKEVMVDLEKVYETTDDEDFPYDKIYVAKWDFKGETGDELTFKRGDLILVADANSSSAWWIGDLLHTDTLKARDQSGLFYSAFVETAFVRVQ